MPPVAAPYVKRPYVGDRLIRLADLGRETARVQANQALQRGDRSAQMWRDTGNAIASGIGAIREERELVPLRQAAQLKMQREAEMLRRQDEEYADSRQAKNANAAMLGRLNAIQAEYGDGRIPTERLEQEGFPPAFVADMAKAYEAIDGPARKNADAVGKALPPGPISQDQMDTLQRSPEQATRTRYSFGPGTADGPELMPTDEQIKEKQVREAVEKMGGVLGPNGQIVMPPKPPAPEKGPAVGSFEDYVVAKYGPRPTPSQIEQARRAYSDTGRAAPGGNGGGNPRVITIGNSFKSEPIVKTAQTMAQAVNFVQGLDLNTNNPADDQALIYAFAKAMDPDSVVREGEYATVQKYSQSLKDKFGFDIARLFSNTTFLTPEARKNLKATIESRFRPVESQYRAVFDEYARRINKITGQQDGADWLTDYGVSFPAAAPAKKNPFR